MGLPPEGLFERYTSNVIPSAAAVTVNVPPRAATMRPAGRHATIDFVVGSLRPVVKQHEVLRRRRPAPARRRPRTSNVPTRDAFRIRRRCTSRRAPAPWPRARNRRAGPSSRPGCHRARSGSARCPRCRRTTRHVSLRPEKRYPKAPPGCRTANAVTSIAVASPCAPRRSRKSRRVASSCSNVTGKTTGDIWSRMTRSMLVSSVF